jgi:thiol-disulfide isomerase/thioredoxin
MIVHKRLFFAIATFICLTFNYVQVYAKCPSVIDEISLFDLSGRPAKLSCSSYKVLVLNLWATWCTPCRIEIPHFIELYSEFKSRGVEIVGISLDPVKSQGVRNFVQSYKINYPVYTAVADEVFDKIGVRAVPVTLIIDGNGRIYKKLVGLYAKDEMRAFIMKILNKQ